MRMERDANGGSAALSREMRELAEYLDGLERTPSLADFLRGQLRERGLVQADVVRTAGLERTFGWFIFNGKRGAGRNTMLRLSFAMGFDAATANEALWLAGANALCPRDRHDAIVIYCLERGRTWQQANDMLYALGEECL